MYNRIIMKYQKIINLLEIPKIRHLHVGQNIGSKQMMRYV